MTDVLDLCPCCKGQADYLSARTEERLGGAVLTIACCINCGMSTRPCSSKRGAAALWNRREQVRDLQTLNEAQALAIQQLTTQLTQAQEDAERSRLDVCCHAGDEAVRRSEHA